MDETQAGAASSSATAAPAGAGTPQIDVENTTLEQLDQLMETGTAELPVKSDGKEKEATPPPKEEKPAKAGEQPPAGEEVVETRSQEEIDQAVTTAVDQVKDEGGDQAAQDAAAEAARQPKPKVEPPPKKDEKEPEDKVRRFRIKDPIAQATLELFKTFENTDTPITLAEAERRVRGEPAPPAKETTPKVEEPTLQQVVSTLEAEVADLKSKLDTAGGDEALFTKEIAQWTQQLAEKTADLKLSKRDLADAEADAKAEAEESAANWKTSVDKSRAIAIEAYPAVADDTTPLGKAVAERITAMRDPSHPDHNLLFAASCPEIVTMKVADELGIAPVKKAGKETPPVKEAEAPPKSKKVEPASGVKSAAGKGPTPEDAKKRVEYLKTEGTLEELDEVFNAKDPLSQLASRAA